MADITFRLHNIVDENSSNTNKLQANYIKKLSKYTDSAREVKQLREDE